MTKYGFWMRKDREWKWKEKRVPVIDGRVKLKVPNGAEHCMLFGNGPQPVSLDIFINSALLLTEIADDGSTLTIPEQNLKELSLKLRMLSDSFRTLAWEKRVSHGD
jgi:hypothetical protein